MAEKLLLSAVIDSFGTELLVPAVELLLLPEVPLLPQAATTRAALAAIAANAAVFVTECKKTTSLIGGTHAEHRWRSCRPAGSHYGRNLLMLTLGRLR
jgi:hypothetical protein